MLKLFAFSLLCSGQFPSFSLQASPLTPLGSPHAGYLCNAEESLHAMGCQEGLPAGPEGDNVPETEQEPVADQHVGVGDIVAVPILM